MQREGALRGVACPLTQPSWSSLFSSGLWTSRLFESLSTRRLPHIQWIGLHKSVSVYLYSHAAHLAVKHPFRKLTHDRARRALCLLDYR